MQPSLVNCAQRGLDTLLNRHCLCCDTKLRPPERYLGVCQPCWRDLPHLRHGCQRCGIELSADLLICGQCLLTPPVFRQCLTPMSYSQPLNSLIGAGKYESQFFNLRILSRWLAQHVRDHITNREIVLIAVPQHKQRDRQRGYNPAAIITRCVAGELALPYHNNLLHRVRAQAPQQGLNARQRQHNLRGAFVCPEPVLGRHIILIDDVVTTGSTANEAARTLLAAGAGSVDVWALARTPKDQKTPDA